jgi:hypothetical protein
MDPFQQELMRRSPLARCVLELSDYALEPRLLEAIFEDGRGRCYQDVLSFEDFVRLTRDALLRHHGSAHKLFLELESTDSHPVDESNFYRKLARTPVAISRALLSEGAARLAPLMPPVKQAPACFKDLELIVADGKKIKNAAKRLLPTRGLGGKLIGAKALVGIDARTGLAVAMSDSLDGLSNDVPLVPALMEQLRRKIARPICSVWDRQFDNQRTMRQLCARAGDAFVVRMNQGHRLVVESSTEACDGKGRKITDQIVVLGQGKRTMRLRRVTLERAKGQEAIVLLSNLLDAAAYPAADLLQLYKMRWNIEQMFQQVTQTFALEHLIGCSPRAVLFQFAFCLLVYNLMQVIQAYVAEDGKVLASAVSLYYLFDRTRQQLCAWACYGGGSWTRVARDREAMTARLRTLLAGSWNAVLLSKAPDKKPRASPAEPKRLHGGHTSVLRALEGRAKLVAVK